MNKTVSIIGGGWAGLSAAVELSKHNIPVIVYESAKQLGGRARRVNLDDLTVDNGQHLMIGAYHQMLELLKTINIDEDVFLRIPMQMQILDLLKGSSTFDLSLPKLPAPFHLLFGMLKTPSLTLKEKIQTLIQFNKLLNKTISHDIDVDTWLDQASLPKSYVNNLLKPLCLAALTTHTKQASAKCFQTVLRQTFNGPRKNTDLLIPKLDLGALFPDAAKAYIESKGGKVLIESKVNKINVEENIAKSIEVNGETIPVDQVIVATSAHITLNLLDQLDICSVICDQLANIEYEPVTTIYLQYPESTSLPLPMVGVINASCEWLFDRKHCKQPGLIAAVISANGSHMKKDNDRLIDEIKAELKQLFPSWPQTISASVIREKKATIRSHTNIDDLRPSTQTPIQNLKLCGDYVYIEENNHPGLPSTLEGAMRSGVKCAQHIINEITS